MFILLNVCEKVSNSVLYLAQKQIKDVFLALQNRKPDMVV